MLEAGTRCQRVTDAPSYPVVILSEFHGISRALGKPCIESLSFQRLEKCLHTANTLASLHLNNLDDCSDLSSEKVGSILYTWPNFTAQELSALHCLVD